MKAGYGSLDLVENIDGIGFAKQNTKDLTGTDCLNGCNTSMDSLRILIPDRVVFVVGMKLY
jgi:hypothetical protein